MFGLSFGELFVIGVVGLIVIGPERLPTVARTLGHLVGRAQRYVNDVKSDIQREVDIQEIAKIKEEMQSAVSDVKSSVEDTASALRNPVNALRDDLQRTGNTLRDSVSSNPATTPQGDSDAAGADNLAVDAQADADSSKMIAPAAASTAAGPQSTTAGVADPMAPLAEPPVEPTVPSDTTAADKTAGAAAPVGLPSVDKAAPQVAQQTATNPPAAADRPDVKPAQADAPASAVTRSDKHS
ncbi:MAG: Sec-independent protein translocase protein TatB [Advenella sp.]